MMDEFTIGQKPIFSRQQLDCDEKIVMDDGNLDKKSLGK